MTKSYDELETAYVNAVADLAHITTELHREAEARGWCSDYAAFVERVEAGCTEPRFVLPQSFRLYMKYEVHIEVDVKAYTLDEAYQTARGFYFGIDERQAFRLPPATDSVTPVTLWQQYLGAFDDVTNTGVRIFDPVFYEESADE